MEMEILAKTPRLSPSEAMQGRFGVSKCVASKVAQEQARTRFSRSFSLFIVFTAVVRRGH